jgi:hypothetical protein
MPRLKLGEILVQNQAIDEATLRRALGSQARFAGQKIRLGQILVDMGACTPSDIARALSQQLNIPLADLSNINPELVARVPEELSRRHQAVAFAVDPGPPEAVRVAFFDPTDLAAVDAIRFKIGKPIRVAIGAGDAISTLIDRAYGAPPNAEPQALDLGEMLFSDSETLSVEHYDASQPLAVSSGLEIEPLASVLPDLFAGGETPASAIASAPATPEPPTGPSTTDSLSDLFGELNSDLGLDPPPSSPVEQGDPVGTVVLGTDEQAPPPVEITRFPDRRRRAPPPPPPAPVPKLVLTTEAFFSPPSVRNEGEAGEPIAPQRPTSDPLADIMAGVELPPDPSPRAPLEAPDSSSLEFDPDSDHAGDTLFGAAEVVGAAGVAGTATAGGAVDAPLSGIEIAEQPAELAEVATERAESPAAEEPTEVDDADLEPILVDEPPSPHPAGRTEDAPALVSGAAVPAPLADEVDSWADSTEHIPASSLLPQDARLFPR